MSYKNVKNISTRSNFEEIRPFLIQILRAFFIHPILFPLPLLKSFFIFYFWLYFYYFFGRSGLFFAPPNPPHRGGQKVAKWQSGKGAKWQVAKSIGQV